MRNVISLSLLFLIHSGMSAQEPTPLQAAKPVLMPTIVYPLDGVVDPSGAVWVVDRNVPGVWKYADSKLEIAIAGSKKFRQPLNACRCIAISKDGTLYVGDPATREVYVRTESNDMKPIMSSLIGIPMDIAIDSLGTIYVADAEQRVVWSKPTAADKPTVFAKANPAGLFVDSQDRLWVVSKDAEQIQRFDSSGKKEVIVSKPTFEFAHQIVVDKSGTAFVSDGYKKAIWKFAEGAEPAVWVSGEPLQNPVGLFLVDDKPVVVDPRAQSVFKLNAEGKLDLWFKIAIP